MKSFYRVVYFLLIIGIVFGSIFLIYKFFASKSTDKTKILAISSSGKFSSSEFKITNSDRFKIKNSDETNQTVKISGTDKTLVELDSNTLSKELAFSDNSKTILYLASDPKQKSTIVVGTPKTISSAPTTKTPTIATKSAAGAVKATNTPGQPLPNTGPGDSLLLSLSAIVGFILLKISNLFWRRVVRRI